MHVIDESARNFEKKFLDIRKSHLLCIVDPAHMSTF